MEENTQTSEKFVTCIDKDYFDVCIFYSTEDEQNILLKLW